jgi:hypothetical protein
MKEVTKQSGKQKRPKGMDIALALALVLLAAIVARELVRQRTARRERRAMQSEMSAAPVVPAAGAAPTVAPGDEAGGSPGRPGPREGAGVGPRFAAGSPPPSPPVRRLPDSRLDDPRAAQRVLRAQTRALREESAADTLDPARRRALSLTQEEILELEKDGRLIF